MQLSLHNLKATVDGKNLLFEIPRLELSENSKTLIFGPSGSGKSTFLHLISGLLQPQSGEVKWDDLSLQKISEKNLTLFRRENLGFVFQRLNLINHLTSSENIWLFDQTKTQQEADKALAQLGLGEKTQQLSSTLSLGEQQRVAVARAQFKKPKIILADEPTSSLDEENATQLIKTLINPGHKQTLVVVSHDLRLKPLFDKVIDFRDWQSQGAKT